MPEPTKNGLSGLDSLSRFPDARVIVVQNDINYSAAVRMFPQNPVVGFNGNPSASYLKYLAGRDAIVMLANPIPNAVASVTDTFAAIGCSSVAFFSPPDPAECWSPAELERHHLPRQWLLQRLKAIQQPTPAIEATPAPVQPSESPASAQRVPNGKPVLGVVEPSGAVRKPATRPDPTLPAGYTEDALAVAFTAKYPDWRYCAPWGKWLAWDGQRWKLDVTVSVFQLARLVCREQGNLAQAAGLSPKSIMKASTHAAVERIARSDPVHAIDSSILDADPWLLNTPDGIIDLTDGTLRPATPDEHMTKVTRCGPTEQDPVQWLKFLGECTAHDAELMGFLQRMAGYSLTGITRDHALFFAYGEGGNGKGTFLNTLSWVMGDYAQTASMDTFTETRSERHPTELAAMMGARLVTAQETEEGRRWNEQRVTSLTGGDPIRARFMRQDEFQFMPQFKLVMSGNHKPGLRNINEAIRRRLHMIPFTVVVPPAQRDPMLADKLRSEAGGILRWAIAGCLEWQRVGLAPPACVLEATEKYLENQDSLGTWIAECCETDALFESTVGALYKSFAAWAESNGEFVLSRRRFSDAMESRGHAIERRGGLTRVRGLHLVPTEPARRSLYD
jgi:P4 family phage/plasmid primase-like protien